MHYVDMLVVNRKKKEEKKLYFVLVLVHMNCHKLFISLSFSHPFDAFLLSVFLAINTVRLITYLAVSHQIAVWLKPRALALVCFKACVEWWEWTHTMDPHYGPTLKIHM
jgi:hypothetical protein